MKILNRIKRNEDFALAIKQGRSFRTLSFKLHVRKNEFEHTRVGISVSKKIGNAVVRNRIKRQTRAMCDSCLDYSKQSLDIVIIIGRSYIDKTYDENNDILKNILSIVLQEYTHEKK